MTLLRSLFEHPGIDPDELEFTLRPSKNSPSTPTPSGEADHETET